jgi:hypothetical protein
VVVDRAGPDAADPGPAGSLATAGGSRLGQSPCLRSRSRKTTPLASKTWRQGGCARKCGDHGGACRSAREASRGSRCCLRSGKPWRSIRNSTRQAAAIAASGSSSRIAGTAMPVGFANRLRECAESQGRIWYQTLVPTSAHLTVTHRVEAGPKPRFRSQLELGPETFKTGQAWQPHAG